MEKIRKTLHLILNQDIISEEESRYLIINVKIPNLESLLYDSKLEKQDKEKILTYISKGSFAENDLEVQYKNNKWFILRGRSEKLIQMKDSELYLAENQIEIK